MTRQQFDVLTGQAEAWPASLVARASRVKRLARPLWGDMPQLPSAPHRSLTRSPSLRHGADFLSPSSIQPYVEEPS